MVGKLAALDVKRIENRSKYRINRREEIRFKNALTVDRKNRR